MDDDRTPEGAADAEVTLRSDARTADELVLVVEDDGLRRWNRTVVEITGYTDRELASMGLEELVATEDVECVLNALERVLERGRAIVEVAMVDADGERLPCELRFVELSDGNDASLFVATGRKIEDRRERRAVLDRMTDAFFAVDEDWRFTYVNERARTMLATAMGRDLDPGELKGLQFWEAVPGAVDTPFYDEYHRAMMTQEPITLEEYYEPLDAWFEVRAYPSRTGLSVYLRDVTERRRQRTALRRRERVLREIYDVTADADRSFPEQIEALLEIGCDVLGVGYATLSRIRGEDYEFEVVRAPEGGVEAGDVVPLSATYCERTVMTEETLVVADVRRDAPELTEKAGYAEWGITCYLGAPVVVDDEPYGTFCFYDTEPRETSFSEWETTLVDLMSQWLSYELARQRTHERLERRNDQLEQFASIVSHDLRNPLNILDGWLGLAEESGEPAHFERCRRATERMESLIDDLLTLARVGERIADPEPVALADLVETCWGNVAIGDATLVVDTERTVRADANRLRQLVENLARNAVEHAGRDVTVTVGDLDDGFYVEDDGPGIPTAERERVFEAGYSTAEEGTGFGLNIVKQVADAHGWNVTVAEGADGGARFEFVGVERPKATPSPGDR